jgi:hypothetical protein
VLTHLQQLTEIPLLGLAIARELRGARLAKSERNPDGEIYWPDLCPRCQRKMEAWMDAIMDALEAEGAPYLDVGNAEDLSEPVPDEWKRKR